MAEPSAQVIAQLRTAVQIIKTAVNKQPSVPELLKHFEKFTDYIFLLRETLVGLSSNDVLLPLLFLHTQLRHSTSQGLTLRSQELYHMVMKWENEFLRRYGRKAERGYLINLLTQLPDGDISQLEEGPGRNYLLGVYQHPDMLALVADLEQILSTFPQPSKTS